MLVFYDAKDEKTNFQITIAFDSCFFFALLPPWYITISTLATTAYFNISDTNIKDRI